MAWQNIMFGLFYQELLCGSFSDSTSLTHMVFLPFCGVKQIPQAFNHPKSKHQGLLSPPKLSLNLILFFFKQHLKLQIQKRQITSDINSKTSRD